MVLELVTFHIIPGHEREFLDHARQHAKNSTGEYEGCHSMQFGADADRPGYVHGVVVWASREAHTRFKTTDERIDWRGRIEPLLQSEPELRFIHEVEHYAAGTAV
ncbi:putative quinol monooxygenase [Streptomyces sp. NPDC020799]|uniref:putative quinol monooxygenase n=1 Tax=Streptomyces sp. NPDC020799 TaxID=3365091 RepID=UPI0037ADFE5E